MQTKDYYKILGIPPSATLKEIKSAYRQLAQQYHPDKSGEDAYSTAQFKLVKEAYEVLSNPGKKERYLQQRWYDQSVGRKMNAEATTPVTILKKALDLAKYVKTLDHLRMDHQGLFAYLCELLSDDAIEVLNRFKDGEINQAIVSSTLESSRHLPWKYTAPVAARLLRIDTDPGTKQAVSDYLRLTRSIDAWQKYKTWLLLLTAILVCLLIYFAAGS